MEPPAALRKRVLTIAEFCFVYGICRTTAYGEINAGRLAVIKCGRRTLITEDAAEAWLRALASRSGGAAPNGNSTQRKAGGING